MSDVPLSLQSWVSTIQAVVLTADVFQLFIKRIQSLSAFLLPFFWAQQLTTPHGNEIFWPAGVSATSREELHNLPGEQQTRGKSRFFIDDVLVVLGYARELRCVRDFGRFSCCWLASSSSRKHLVSRFWMPTTAAWRTRRCHTPHRERPWLSGAFAACEEL